MLIHYQSFLHLNWSVYNWLFSSLTLSKMAYPQEWYKSPRKRKKNLHVITAEFRFKKNFFWLITLTENQWINVNSLSTIFTPVSWAGCDTRLIFKQSKAGLNSEISFFQTGFLIKARSSLFNNKPIAAWRIARRNTSWKVLAPNEMQTASSKIWNQVANSICYDDNHSTKFTSIKFLWSHERMHELYMNVSKLFIM